MSDNTNPSGSLFDLSFDENLKQSLRGAAHWAGIAAIVSFAGSVLGIVNYFIQRAKLQAMYSQYESLGVSSPAMAGGMISAFISFAIGVVLFVFLLKFSKKSKLGVDTGEAYHINEGLSGLSVYFKIIGIVLIIVIIFSLLGLATLLGQM